MARHDRRVVRVQSDFRHRLLPQGFRVPAAIAGRLAAPSCSDRTGRRDRAPAPGGRAEGGGSRGGPSGASRRRVPAGLSRATRQRSHRIRGVQKSWPPAPSPVHHSRPERKAPRAASRARGAARRSRGVPADAGRRYRRRRGGTQQVGAELGDEYRAHRIAGVSLRSAASLSFARWRGDLRSSSTCPR